MPTVLSKTAHCHKLPPEALSLVFEYALEEIPRHGTGRYFRELLLLCRVCHYWRVVARSAALFWCDFDISSNDNPDFVGYLLALSRSCPLRLRIAASSWPIPQSPDSRVIQAVLPHLSRAHSLVIMCATRTSGQEIYLALREALFGQVTSLQLDVDPDLPILWLNHTSMDSMHQLRTLRLRHAAVSWGLSAMLSRLHTLVLRDLDSSAGPEWKHWEAICESSPSIQRVCLRNIGCVDVPINPQRLTLTLVTHLDLFFGVEESTLTKLVAAFHLPMLCSLTVGARSAASLATIFPAIIRHGKTNGIHRLALRLQTAEFADLYSLFVSAPRLRQLYTARFRSDSNVVDALCTPLPQTHAVVCPDLRSLVVSNAHPQELRRLVQYRHGASDNLREVMFRNALPEGSYYTGTLVWLRSRVALHAHAPPFETWAWEEEYE
ncbi:hypothetical protein C8R47DRAFT_1230480 [Mycena vitilis]|nr:hypothetical protein C8R47DRAFT_1230990 [Mycena vitilis]KAJ6449905.1 hypothetical protein C8R47DRAFT_1230480 [Mycena vitilis]